MPKKKKKPTKAPAFVPDAEQLRRADLVRRVGVACFGPNWKAPLGKEIGYTREMVYRWDVGSNPVAGHIEGKLLAFLKRHRAAEKAKAKAIVAFDGELAALEAEISAAVHRGRGA